MTSPTVLIVDDDASFRRVLEYQLKQAGYDVLKAEDGKKALDIFSQNPCHAVLTDLAVDAGIALDQHDPLRPGGTQLRRLHR